jgi:hypothetical protein
MNRTFAIYRVKPGVSFWLFGVCRSLFWHRQPQGWRLEYVRYDGRTAA